MTATDGYPQNNINPKGNTPMSTETITTAATRYLNVELLDLGDQCTGLMPGDTVHIEATLRVRAVQHGLDHKDEPTETVSVKPTGDKPDVVVRTSTWRALTEDGEQYGIDLFPAAPSDTERPAWPARHKLDLKIGAGVLGFAAWVAGIAFLVVILAGCGTGSSASTPSPSPAPAPVAQCDGCLPNHLWAASGEECTRIGAKAIGRKGGTLLCKPAPASNIAVGDNAPRWRKA